MKLTVKCFNALLYFVHNNGKLRHFHRLGYRKLFFASAVYKKGLEQKFFIQNYYIAMFLLKYYRKESSKYSMGSFFWENITAQPNLCHARINFILRKKEDLFI